MTGHLLVASDDGAPADEAQVVAIRAAVSRLVALDVATGGGRASVVATQALRAAETMLAPCAFEPKVERDLRAAVAELAEVTGWLLCDANRHAASLARNQQALHLAHSVGDRSMELFVIHNMSLQATYLRRPERSLALVRPILDQAPPHSPAERHVPDADGPRVRADGPAFHGSQGDGHRERSVLRGNQRT